MSKHRSQGRALDPADVLSGRVKPSAGELLHLIHRVNPTGHDLAAREAELRYAQKSRLQSLLVRRFGPEIEVVPDPDREGTVSLLHRGHGRDGCHAVIAALDEDARAWVQLQVDLGPPSSAAPEALAPRARAVPEGDDDEPEDTTPDALLRAAGEAIDAYDYERAQGLLGQALAASGGAPEPAAALLALLVDTLGDDAGGLAIEASLSREAMADRGVRGALAIAAARTGDEARALSLVRGAEESLAATVFASLASAAITRGHVEEAAAHLEQTRRLDGAHPSIEGLAGEVAKARAKARGPAEEELSALVARGPEDEVEEKAREVLSRWPESEAARRVLRGIEDRRQRQRASQLVTDAEAALAAGDVTAAGARLSQALVLARGPEREAIERRLREVEARAHAAREEARVARVQELLDARDTREGLLAYLDLDEGLRGRVRSGAAGEALRWLELTGRGAPRARVEAVLALAKARDRLDADPDAALASITHHGAVLDPVPEARQILREAEARLAALRATHARTELAAARSAFAAGHAVEALRRIGEATARDLPPGERAEAAALREEASRVVQREQRAADVARLRAAGQLFEARALAKRFAHVLEGEEGARWDVEGRAIQETIQRVCRVEVDHEPVPMGEGGMPSAIHDPHEALRWLADDGDAIVLAEEHERWVRVRVVYASSLTVSATVMLRAPEPLGNVRVEVRGRTVWLIGGLGAVLALSMDGWEVQRYRPASELLPAGETVGSVALVADAGVYRYLWVAFHHDGAPRARVLDLEQRRPAHEIQGVSRVRMMPDLWGVECWRDDMQMAYDPGGTRRIGGSTQAGALPGMARHPTGKGAISFGRVALDEGTVWAKVESDLSDADMGDPVIEGSNGDMPVTIATAKEDKLTAIVHAVRGGGTRLLVIGGDERPAVEIYRLPVSEHTKLLQDGDSRRVVLLQMQMGHRRAARVGPAPPDLPLLPENQWPWIPSLIDLLSCAVPTGARIAAYADVAIAARRADVATLTSFTQAEVQRRVGKPQALIDLVHGLFASGQPIGVAQGQMVRLFVIDQHPDVPGVRLLQADVFAIQRRWGEVREVLSSLSIEEFDDGRARHFDHLLALALLWLGDLEAARAAVRDAKGRDGICSMEAFDHLLTPPSDLASPEAWGEDRPPLVQLVGGVHAADACLARDDAAGALAALERELFWACREVQTLARLAEASLRVPPGSRRARFRRITALSKFVVAHAMEEPNQRAELPIPGAIWDRGRLDALAGRARTWLEESGPGADA